MKKYAAGALVCLVLCLACIRSPAAHAQQGSGSCRVTAVVGQPDPTREPEDGNSSNQPSTQEPEHGDSDGLSDMQEPEDGGSSKPLPTEGAGDRDSSKPFAEESGESAAGSIPQAAQKPSGGEPDPGSWKESPEGIPGTEDGRQTSEGMPDPGDKRQPGSRVWAGTEPDPSQEPVSAWEGVSDGAGSGCRCFCRLCLPVAVLMYLCSLILMAVGRKRAVETEEMKH